MVKINRKLILTVSSYVLVALIAFSITYTVVKFRERNSNGLIEHGPIIIVNDNDFEVYNFPGKGTAEVPYLIQNYNITTDYSESIYISGTSKYFIIQNCYLNADFKSLVIENLVNSTAIIRDNTIVCDDNYDICVSIIGSENITIENNKIKNLLKTWPRYWPLWDFRTIEIIQCESTVVKGNYFIGQNIYVQDSGNTTFSNNLFRRGDYGLSAFLQIDSPSITTTSNTFKVRAHLHIYSYNNTFSNNTFTDRSYAYLYAFNNTFSGNNFLTEADVYIDSPNSIIKDNKLASGGYVINHETSIDNLRSYLILNNTVATKYLGYFVDSEGLTLSSSNYGQLYFVNCEDFTVSGFNIASYRLGLIFAHCRNVVVNGIGLITSPYDTELGIEFYNSTECEVTNSGLWASECINIVISSNISISDVSFGWSGCGVRISSSTNILISNNQFNDQQDTGITASFSEDVQLINNTFFKNIKGISISHSSNILVSGNKLDVNEEYAIWSTYNDFIEIYDNSIWGGYRGIYCRDSANSTITNNRLREIFDTCIFLYSNENLTVNSNNCGDSTYGIYGKYLWNSTLDNNEFYHTEQCLFITLSNNCTISETYSSTSLHGMWIFECYDLLVIDNTILYASWGIYADCGVKDSIFRNNTCLYGFIGIGVLDSSSCTFEFNILNNNDRGLYLLNVEDSIVQNNTCSYNNELGLWILNATDCIFRYNQIENNTQYGAYFEDSYNNTLCYNLIANNTYYGIIFYNSSNNIVYHNAFITNYLPTESQAYDDTGTNFWYNIGLGEGNYWSGWNSGLGAYSIDGPGSSSDPYPLDTNPL
jgi:parallel beta-helix repeat protein